MHEEPHLIFILKAAGTKGLSKKTATLVFVDFVCGFINNFMVCGVVSSFAQEFTARLKYACPEGFGRIPDHFSTNSRAALSRRKGKKTLLSEFTLDILTSDTRMDKETI